MDNVTWDLNGIYSPMYRQFCESEAQQTGYRFGEQELKPIPPPTVTFARPLKWWSWDRPKRLGSIRRLRDQLQIEILKLGPQPLPAVTGGRMGTNLVKSLRESMTSRLNQNPGETLDDFFNYQKTA